MYLIINRQGSVELLLCLVKLQANNIHFSLVFTTDFASGRGQVWPYVAFHQWDQDTSLL